MLGSPVYFLLCVSWPSSLKILGVRWPNPLNFGPCPGVCPGKMIAAGSQMSGDCGDDGGEWAVEPLGVEILVSLKEGDEPNSPLP